MATQILSTRWFEKEWSSISWQIYQRIVLQLARVQGKNQKRLSQGRILRQKKSRWKDLHQPKLLSLEPLKQVSWSFQGLTVSQCSSITETIRQTNTKPWIQQSWVEGISFIRDLFCAATDRHAPWKKRRWRCCQTSCQKNRVTFRRCQLGTHSGVGWVLEKQASLTNSDENASGKWLNWCQHWL